MTETLTVVEEPHPLVEVHAGPLVEARDWPAPVYIGEHGTDLIYCFALGVIVGLGIYSIIRRGM